LFLIFQGQTVPGTKKEHGR